MGLVVFHNRSSRALCRKHLQPTAAERKDARDIGYPLHLAAHFVGLLGGPAPRSEIGLNLRPQI